MLLSGGRACKAFSDAAGSTPLRCSPLPPALFNVDAPGLLGRCLTKELVPLCLLVGLLSPL